MRKLFALALLIGTLLHADYSIQLQDNPSPAVKNAAVELEHYLKLRTGGQLVIGGQDSPVICVGDTPLAQKLNLCSDKLQPEQWVIRSSGKQLLLNGGGTRGVLYAVYHFLEDYCDIHWWNDTEEYVPDTSKLTLPALNISGRPMFQYRDIYVGGYEKMYLWASRNRLNRCGDQEIPAQCGASFTYGPPYHCHTAVQYVPEQEYYSSHPEYFALIDGQRKPGRDSQVCLSNPDIRKVYLEKLLAFIEAGSKAAAEKGLEAPKLYDISMNDNWNVCQCDACKAEVKKYGQSGFYINFANWLATSIRKKHPDIYLSILAYFYMDEPPIGGVHADDHVIVKLCDTRTNQASSLLEKDNRVFVDFLDKWKRCANSLYIWDYAITYGEASAGMPFASEFFYGDLFRKYLESNVTGVFIEHEEPFLSDAWEMKAFLEAKLMENPFQNVDALINLFMDRYYGAAAPLLLQYRKLLDQARRRNNGFISWFPKVQDFNYIDQDTRRLAQTLFVKAENAVALDQTRLLRVRHLRLGLDRYCAAVNDGDFASQAKQRIIDYWPAWMKYRNDNKNIQKYFPSK